jgi:hypothetical protein
MAKLRHDPVNDDYEITTAAEGVQRIAEKLGPLSSPVKLQTTDGTPTVAFTHTLQDKSSAVIFAEVSGKRTDGSNTGRLAYIIRGAAYRENAGAAALQGPLQTPLARSGGGAGAWDVDIDVSGNDVRIIVTGAVGHTVEWTVRAEVVEAE